MFERDFFGEEALGGGSRIRCSGSDEAASDFYPYDYDLDPTPLQTKSNEKVTKVSTEIQKLH
jgi:hypothetical protein